MKPLHRKSLWAIQKADGELACEMDRPPGSAPSLFDDKPPRGLVTLDDGSKWKFVRVRVVLDKPKRASRRDSGKT